MLPLSGAYPATDRSANPWRDIRAARPPWDTARLQASIGNSVDILGIRLNARIRGLP